jgi:capsular polysaccharide transport system permease protein
LTSEDPSPPINAIERARLMSQALASAARRARVSRKGKSSFNAGGFQARRGARLVFLALLISFVVMVAVPTAMATIYFAFVASNQYVADTQFTVMGGEVQQQDGFANITGIPAMAIIQDTQIVANYIHSRAAVDLLDEKVGLRALYARDDVDALSRAPRDLPIEEFLPYWRKMASVSIQMPSGIVDVHVRAFSAADAVKIGRGVVEISERLINDLNLRMNADLLRNTENELQRASQRLAQARSALEKARNQEGLLDAQRSADALNKLITEARGSLLVLQQEQATQLRYVTAGSPQMKVLKSRIEAARAQIAELEAKLTSSRGEAASGDKALSASITTFAMLDLERQIAERLYAGAAAAAETARLISERKAMYLNTFVWPHEPEYPLYPKRLMSALLWSLGAFTLWGALAGVAAAARNHMA